MAAVERSKASPITEVTLGDHIRNVQSLFVFGSSPICSYGPLCLHTALGTVHARVSVRSRLLIKPKPMPSSPPYVYIHFMISLTFFIFFLLLILYPTVSLSSPSLSVWVRAGR